MRVIPLTSILSHKGRGSHFHLSAALHRSMKTRNDTGRLEIVTKSKLTVYSWGRANVSSRETRKTRSNTL